MLSLASWEGWLATLPLVLGAPLVRGASGGTAEGMVGGESDRAGIPIAGLVEGVCTRSQSKTRQEDVIVFTSGMGRRCVRRKWCQVKGFKDGMCRNGGW